MKKVKICGIIMFLILLCPFVIKAEEQNYEIAPNYFVSNSKIIRTVSLLDEEGNVLSTSDFELTEEQFESNYVSPQEYMFKRNLSTTYSTNPSTSYSTDTKRLTMTVTYIPNGSYRKRIDIECEWLKMPNVRLYDVIGWTVTNTESNVRYNYTYSVKQIYDDSTGAAQEIEYIYNSGNRVTADNGEALVMNVVNDAKTRLKMTYTQEIETDTIEATFKGSYQHATSTSITANEAKSLTFGTSASSGYQVIGGAFIYTTSIANKYDRMSGVTVNYNPAGL